MLRAESKGRYFNQHIRNCFVCAKIALAHAAQPENSALHKATE
ncbi:MAG: KTSC domain-containing protein [Acidobacteria bacterium]|nr:KTSC domain-containing protein [Acidobacteriota bacterium]